MPPTSRLGLSRPAGTDAISAGDDAITANANALDNAAIDLQGVFTARPAANAVATGTYFYATDAQTLWRSDGATWLEVQAGPIQTTDIANGAVTGVKIANGSVSQAHMAFGALQVTGGYA